ncbi:DEAD/DEAH box helicase [Methanocella sp. CWC-04]|uniref:DEAD/DEAH box helicase n=1 Tax=Methanooceanicella nereidis TaxID=2052831 RepID=A0AAP2RF17_9EURY|nr:DEAD/DEAH box helicase family protein [Methanocella sp. CWC-04]MCD1295022.1 DEAD/DEAH box helicase [Methanocella sp. CWC-04]
MEFRFDANQEYQLQAVNSICDLFIGQPKVELELIFGISSIANRLDISDADILENLKNVQSGNGIKIDDSLDKIEAEINTANGTILCSFPNFSVEMETGTGKTYVYLRTIFELYKQYGMRKFIVVVPSVAIREGVIKTLKITKKHFQELYSNIPYRFYTYDSASLTRVRQFAQSDSIEIMVMTIAAFNKDINIIKQSTDRLQGDTPIHMIQATRPILILDEPQNMESEKSIAALSALFPLFALRYSATHRNPYNVIYRLTPYDAYKKNLVKKIEVASVIEKDGYNKPFIKIMNMDTNKNTITASLLVHKLKKNGSVHEAIIKVKPGDSLLSKTLRQEYENYIVDEINPGRKAIIFSNGVELSIGETEGLDKNAIFKAQISTTIEEHFKKQVWLKKNNIKVLSLFFIDQVNNYISHEGIIRRLFNESFNQIKLKYEDWLQVNPEEVQAAYFAQTRKKDGTIIYEDSTSGISKKDEEAYNLIMKDKERILSFNEPVSFIFSHSALREGWDNPNIFQICTLNQTSSEIKKRQEIGRGIRLAVDQSGQRVHDETINVLTVIANESYDRYAEALQKEYEVEYGTDGIPDKPGNAYKSVQSRLRNQFILCPEFIELWDRIKYKTQYSVDIDTDSLIREVVEDLDKIEIKPPRIITVKASLKVEDEKNKDVMKSYQIGAEKLMEITPGQYLPDIVSVIIHLLRNSSPPICLTRNTILEIIKCTIKKHEAIKNPQEFALITARLIKNSIAEQLVNGIKYEKNGKWYEMQQFEEIIRFPDNTFIPSERSIYTYVKYDSNVEKEFIKKLDERKDVKMFVKLPSWFLVSTPVGNYNPDWAIIMEENRENQNIVNKPLLYLVRETKSQDWDKNPRRIEKYKTRCAEKHFKNALNVDYKIIDNADQLP